ncbi:MAG: ATP-binding cassette domain-containing protein [Proteobacteria bacterium]|nr:ATP-binding cassette domain-containing protein [Pseudomonadota bacterium]
MKAAPLPSPCLDQDKARGLRLCGLSFLSNGPYSLDILPGECIGLTGRSGVGKTQLLRAVADVISHRGDCLLDGTACSAFEAPVWRRTVAMVVAESCWWHDTVSPHFAGGMEEGQCRDWLMKMRLPLDAGGWRVSRLSTGERQRLSLVRSLMNTPRVLLLDEPTSALDREMVQVVEGIIADICEKKQTICLWVSHDREQLIRMANRIYRVEAQGLVEEVNECR